VNPSNAADGDTLIAALARLVEALDDRYPDGPTALAESDLAMSDDMPNMPIVLDPDRPPAA
jgi:hypothetical protein